MTERISKRAPVLDRIMARRVIHPETGCWLYTGQGRSGYGVIGYQGKNQMVHRVARILLVGPIPDGHVGDHECHNADISCPGGVTCWHRRCFNPEHVKPVPRSINDRTGRHGSHLASRTHCPAGHAYAEFGVRYPSSRGRQCRECKRLRAMKWYYEVGRRQRGVLCD